MAARAPVARGDCPLCGGTPVTPVFFSAGDGSGWAIDEDLRLIRASIAGLAEEVSLPHARVVHSPFWVGLGMHDPAVLARRFVVAHADNPPFFYLTQPEFLMAQKLVRLWVARSREALQQFQLLGLPACLIPYAIDPALFFPLSVDERRSVRCALGLPPDSYVIGNFHRDSEGGDLTRPKLQKAPELLVAICRKLKAAGANIHVLLAGPRRHYIRNALLEAGIPFTFAGKAGIDGDDLRENILPRARLNELYNACDVHVIPSRWEGGPQSVMECAAARVKTLSTPVGVACDILEPESLFHTASEAAERVLCDIRSRVLEPTIPLQHARWEAHHTLPVMRNHLRELYSGLNASPPPSKPTPVRDTLREARFQMARRLPARKVCKFGIVHQSGHDACLDAAIPVLVRILSQAGLSAEPDSADCLIGGHIEPDSPFAGRICCQIASPATNPALVAPRTCLICTSAQDAVNHRAGGGRGHLLVCPMPALRAGPNKEPLLVESEHQSLDVIAALSSGRPIVHAKSLHYTHTVYHGGIPCGEETREKQRALNIAARDAPDFAALARPPTESSVTDFFTRLARMAICRKQPSKSTKQKERRHSVL
jgi:glycosyltransferase involved in cell wall biosynthesis